LDPYPSWDEGNVIPSTSYNISVNIILLDASFDLFLLPCDEPEPEKVNTRGENVIFSYGFCHRKTINFVME
jgi:hypothetical protein